MTHLVWNLFEVGVNFFQGFIMIFFAYKFLGDKKDITFLKSGLPYCFLLAAVITAFNSVMVFEHLYAISYIIIVFIYSALNLKGNILAKMFTSVFPLLIILITTAFVGNFTSVIFCTPLEKILSDNSPERFIAILVEQFIIIYCILFFLKIVKKDVQKKSDLALGEWALISIVLIISIVIGAFLNTIAFEITSYSGKLLVLMIFAGIIIINIAVCYLVVDLGVKNQAMRENEILKIEQEYNRQFITNANMEYDVIRKLRHDFKDSCSVINSLLFSGDLKKATEYIKDYMGELIESETFVKTNNEVVNAVINSKFTAAKSLGISVSCLSVSDFSGIADIDLCRLLSNMIENAVTACVESKRPDKQIYLKISFDEYKYCFCLKNTIDTSVLSRNPNLVSNKRNNNNEHGYGVKILHDLADKYSGKCDFYELDDMFCCSVILKR